MLQLLAALAQTTAVIVLVLGVLGAIFGTVLAALAAEFPTT